MKALDLQSISIDGLWKLYEEVGQLLTTRLVAEKLRLEGRLSKLRGNVEEVAASGRRRRPYPKVEPKFHNPTDPAQIWSGRGKQPRWVSEVLETGRNIEELRIPETE